MAASGGGGGGELEGAGVLGWEDWNCPKCSWINQPADLACQMCFSVRVDTRLVSTTWMWSAGPDGWITFDLETCAQLEEAHKLGLEEVPLTAGFFADKPDYLALLRGPPEEWQQLNTSTGNARPIKRLAKDDDQLYIPVDPSTLTSEDLCGICQCEFLGPPGDEDQAPAASGAAAPGQPQQCDGSEQQPQQAQQPAANGNEDQNQSQQNNQLNNGSNVQQSLDQQRQQSNDSGPHQIPQVVRLPKCSHAFCKDCLPGWIVLHQHCPICRTPIQ